MPRASWTPQQVALHGVAIAHGLDETTADQIVDRELSDWTVDELTSILRKTDALRAGKVLKTSDPDLSAVVRIYGGIMRPLIGRPFVHPRIRAGPDWLRQSADRRLALCINAQYQVSLRQSGYIAISHVWSEGFQGDEFNRGIFRHEVDKLFSLTQNLGATWIWLDVFAIPSGHRALSAEEERIKTDIINTLDAVYRNADAVVVLDALLMSFRSTELVEVAVVLLCGRWMTRVWTYQEAVLAPKILLITGAGIVSYDDMVDALRKANNNLHWDGDESKLEDEQLRKWNKYRILYMTFDVLRYKADTRVSLADVAFSCGRRTTSNDVDYARAFYAVLELKWQVGMTKEEGMQKIYKAQQHNVPRLILMQGAPRSLLYPGWAPDQLTGLDGEILPRKYTMKWEKRGIRSRWRAWKVLEVQWSEEHPRMLFYLSHQGEHGTKRISIACSRSEREKMVDVRAVERLIRQDRVFALATDTIKRRGSTVLLIEKIPGLNAKEGYVLFTLRLDLFERTEQPMSGADMEWLLRHENPFADIDQGGKNRAEAFVLLASEEELSGGGTLHVLIRDNNLTGIRDELAGRPDLEQRNAHGRTPLHVAARLGLTEAVKLLLDHGAAVDARDTQQRTPLIFAVESHDPDTIMALASAGADINHAESMNTPLAEAVLTALLNIVELVISLGADVRGDKTELWPLMLACDHPAILRALLNAGADVNQCGDTGLRTIMFAARKGNAESVAVLIEHGAELDRQMTNGEKINALYYGIQVQALDVVSLLLHHGANPNTRYEHDVTPLMFAAETGNGGVLTVLLDAGAEVEMRGGPQLRSALQFAAFHGRRVAIKILLERGAVPRVRDREGHTAIDLARIGGHASSVEALAQK